MELEIFIVIRQNLVFRATVGVKLKDIYHYRNFHQNLP